MEKNCWEIKGCGRERGGKNEKELGLCPAAADERLHGAHGGINAGRACWVVAGTFCHGEVQGTFARKLQDCTLCNFFQLVRKEEGMNFETPVVLLSKLKTIKGGVEGGGSLRNVGMRQLLNAGCTPHPELRP